MRNIAIITAGGNSSRFGGTTNKLLEKLNGKEIIKYSVMPFIFSNKIDEIIICSNSNILETLIKIFSSYKKVCIIEGGNTRQESVFKGLKQVNEADYVLIHDGARPFITTDFIEKILCFTKEKKAVSVMTKTTDTIKEVDCNHKIIKTLNRDLLYNTQTPQVFEYKLIKNAHERLCNKTFTDDAALLEYLGENVYCFEGMPTNIKITNKSDIELAKHYLKIYGKTLNNSI